MEYVSTNNAPGAIGPYSQAVKTGNLLFTSGQIAINPATGNVEATTIEAQTRQVCENLKAVVEAAGTSLDSARRRILWRCNGLWCAVCLCQKRRQIHGYVD